ncbi:MAG: NAD(P)-dependent oxidoreductase [candidate division Zixibacteria bacterium]|nr:NAD(P)-dependent oxidoreductase [candidate division Zixibacteria bacterium]
MNRLPSIIVTGASGFVGRALLDELKNECRIFAIARRSQYECNAPVHPNIAWLRSDISHLDSVAKAFREIATAGGADYLIHLAAYYDFTGQDHPDYWRTNVDGTRYVLELAKDLDLKLLVFTSSVAACEFPPAGKVLDETSPADGRTHYARSKSQGEDMIRQYADKVPACIVRLGAVYSDWCEYPPLYVFLKTWLGASWKANVLAGVGQSAVPYIHIRDVVSFFRQILAQREKLAPAETVIASTRGATSHLKMYSLATRYFYGKTRKPVMMPRLMCGLGLWGMNIWGHLTKNPPFERPWMYSCIDLQLTVQNEHSCELLGWSPDTRHLIERRLPFLVERLKSEPFAWDTRNLATLKRDTARPNLRIYTALSNSEDKIVYSLVEQISVSRVGRLYPRIQQLDRTELAWLIRLLYRLLLTSIDAGNKMLILNYFEISGLSRFQAGYTADEISYLLTMLNDTILAHLGRVDELKPFSKDLYDYISVPIEFGKDEINYQFQLYLQRGPGEAAAKETPASAEARTARELLEETIWSCLVQRK